VLEHAEVNGEQVLVASGSGRGVDLARRIGALGLAGRAYEDIAATGARPRRILRRGSTRSPRASGA
jgi:hypothetical protein